MQEGKNRRLYARSTRWEAELREILLIENRTKNRFFIQEERKNEEEEKSRLQNLSSESWTAYATDKQNFVQTHSHWCVFWTFLPGSKWNSLEYRNSSPFSRTSALHAVNNLITPSEVFVETLVNHRTKYVFGIVGSAYMDALDLFPTAGIDFVSVQHEQNAVSALELKKLLQPFL